MTRDVFISYASPDQQVAFAVCHILEEHKIRCWIAPRDIPAGQWGQQIISAIQQSRVMVVVLSDHSNASHWVMKEVERAVNYRLVIIPIRVADVEPRGSLEFLLAGVHWLDALTPPVEQHIEELASRVELILKSGDDAAARPARGPLASVRRTALARLMSPTGAAVAVALGLALLPVAADFVAHLHVAPPWPDRLAVDLFTGLVNAVIVCAAVLAWRELNQREVLRRLARLGAATAALFIIYLLLKAAFVWDAPTPHDQDVVGFLVLPVIHDLMADDRSLNLQMLLNGARNEPMNVWVGWTVVLARVAVLTAWLAFYIAFSAVTALLLCLAQSRTEPAPAPAGPGS